MSKVKLEIIFGEEDIVIVNAEDKVEVIYWHQEEWIEDPQVVFSICNAIKLVHTDPQGLFEIHQSHYIAAKAAGYIYK
jgi:hypothetical protein